MSRLTTEAVELVRKEADRRRAQRKTDPLKPLLVSSADFIASYVPGARERKPQRMWAREVAAMLTYDEWERLIWQVHDQVRDFPGDVIGYFEVAFDGLSLADGRTIFH